MEFQLIAIFSKRWQLINFTNALLCMLIYTQNLIWPATRPRDGTGQDFLDPTRPVNFKIIAGWPARSTGYFTEGFSSLFNVFKEKFSKGGHGWGVKICNFGRGSQKKKRKKSFAVFAKMIQFYDLFWLSFGLNDLFWAAQNVHKIIIKRSTGGHKLNY